MSKELIKALVFAAIVLFIAIFSIEILKRYEITQKQLFLFFGFFCTICSSVMAFYFLKSENKKMKTLTEIILGFIISASCLGYYFYFEEIKSYLG